MEQEIRGRGQEPLRDLSLAIRDATDADLARIVDVYNQAVPGRMATADTEPVTVEARREWFRAHSAERNPLWVLEDAGRVSAWLSLNAFYGRPAYAATKEVSVYVDSEARRRGFARRLLEHAIDRAPALGIRTLLGIIFSHNGPSLDLFRAYGFESWGELPRVAVLDGVERSVSILGRRLG
jgi:L-amino acid N-acyltransferase YncA